MFRIAIKFLLLAFAASCLAQENQAPANPAAPADAQAARPSRPRIGLALEGGGALGFAHIGVLRWFEEHHIPIDYIAGTSMGGLIGGLYARRLIRYRKDSQADGGFCTRAGLEHDYRRANALRGSLVSQEGGPSGVSEPHCSRGEAPAVGGFGTECRTRGQHAD